MRNVLIVLFATICVSMICVTTIASLDCNILEAGPVLWPHWWFKATLLDAYFAFLAIYVWIAWKEKTMLGRAIWFVLVMSLGSIAISAYMLRHLCRQPPNVGMRAALLGESNLEIKT